LLIHPKLIPREKGRGPMVSVRNGDTEQKDIYLYKYVINQIQTHLIDACLLPLLPQSLLTCSYLMSSTLCSFVHCSFLPNFPLPCSFIHYSCFLAHSSLSLTSRLPCSFVACALLPLYCNGNKAVDIERAPPCSFLPCSSFYLLPLLCLIFLA